MSAPKKKAKPTPKQGVREGSSPRARARTRAREPSGPATLVISEKQIAAQRIAEILSDGGAKAANKGKIPIYRFSRDGREFRVVGLSGHVVAVDYPSELNRWNAVNPRDLILADPIKKIPRGSMAIVNSLRDAAEGVDEVLIATDFDREGELIGQEGLDLLGDAVRGARIRRPRFSSLTAKEVKHAFSEPAELDRNLAAAGESRQWVDLAWGAVLTRILTMAARQQGRDVLSVGRVQSPTLALIVDLEKRIRAFKTKPYWVLAANLGDPPGFEARHPGPSARDATTTVDADEDAEAEEGEEPKFPAYAFPDEAAAQAIYERIRAERTAMVERVDRSERVESAPTPFNTTAFLQAAGGLGLGAARAMSLAEELYMRGYISYPRTDNTVYPPTEDLEAILDALAKAGEFRPDLEYLGTVRRPEPTRGKKTATDHPPIHPVEAARRHEVSPEAWRVYELVVRRFFGTLAKDSTGENMRVGFRIGDEPFRATGFRITFHGWKKLYPYSGSQERPLPALQEGHSVPVQEILFDRKDTQPPKRFGQGRLIAEMERLGLGTKSTRHDIIDKLLSRHYLRGPKSLEPTDVGFAVTDALERYADVIAKPEMTAQLEEEMELVAQGQKAFDEVVADSRKLLTKAVDVLEKNHEQLSKDLQEAMLAHNNLGPCPQCGKPLVTIRSRAGKRFVGCTGYPACRQTYPLPQMGRLQPMRETCEACGAPRVRIFRGGRPPWELCVNMECPDRERRAAEAAASEPAAAAQETK